MEMAHTGACMSTMATNLIRVTTHRLKLQILCTYGTPIKTILDIWPAFPIVLDLYSIRCLSPNDEDNAITTLEHPERVCSIRLSVTGLQLRKIATLMQEPFPLLTCLFIESRGRNVPFLPAKFLGESAPCLQKITLSHTPYPALPTLLLSTSGLITLTLCRIQPTGYISPETMVACLAALPRLESFTTKLQSPTPRAVQIRPPPVTRAFLPALTSFWFRGTSEYLEDLVAHMDSPQLNWIHIDSLNKPVDFQVAQLSTFIDRSVGPKLTPSRRAHICCHSVQVVFTLYRHGNYQDWDRRRHVETTITSESSEWQVSHWAEVLSRFSAALHTVAHLEVDGQLQVWEDRGLAGEDDVDWLHLFHQFPALQTLHVSRHLAYYVALALDDATGELPSLGLICLEGQPKSTVEKLEFVAARRLSGRPVTVVNEREEFDKRLKSYIS